MKKTMARNVHKKTDAEVMALNDITVWDTAYFAASRASEHFIQGIQASMLPLATLEYKGDQSFHTRWISTQLAGGSAIRWSCAAHTTRRTENDIADSTPSGYAVLYAVAGGIAFKQGRNEITVAPGNAVLYDLDQPLQIDMLTAPQRDFLLITLPREKIVEPLVSSGASSRAA
jgi:hypothetical protein